MTLHRRTLIKQVGLATVGLGVASSLPIRLLAGDIPMSTINKHLPRSTPEKQGISSAALLAFVQDAEQKIDALHSMMLIRHGHVVAAGWWAPYAAEEPHAVYSISKSFTSTAVGLAVGEGKLSINDPVIKFFPDEAPANPSKNLSSMRVRDLLRLSTGHRAADFTDFPYRDKVDLVRAFLELPVPDKPGTHFVYDEPGVYLLSAIVQKTTGQTVLDYLRPRLFEPLGISNPIWWASAQGVSLGASGLSLRTEDIARFGQLYLQKGQWQGRQLVPAAWVDAATSLQTATGSDPDSDGDQGYGYLFWRLKHGFYGCAGLLGQFCIVMPEFNAVLAITAASRRGPPILDAVWDRIVPAFKDSALAADPESNQRLSEKLATLTLKTQTGEVTSPIAAKIAGKRYAFPENPQRIESLELEAKPGETNVTMLVRIADKEQRVVCGSGAWAKGTLAPDCGALVPMEGYLGADSGEPVPIAVSGAWSGGDAYTAILCRYQTAFISTYDMRFSGNELILERDHAGSDGTDWVRLIGKAQS